MVSGVVDRPDLRGDEIDYSGEILTQSRDEKTLREMLLCPMVSERIHRQEFAGYSSIKDCSSGGTGFEPRTPRVPSTRVTFSDVRGCPSFLEIIALSSARVF